MDIKKSALIIGRELMYVRWCSSIMDIAIKWWEVKYPSHKLY